MFSKSTNMNIEKFIIYLLLIIFIITEIIDFLLDYWLRDAILHSILQLFLFLSLFIITYRIFIGYSKRKMKKLIPEELMNILKIINEAREKGILINQRKMGKLLNITKPTLKKRVDALLELQYVFFEDKGNHKYFRITSLGDSLIN